MVTGGGHDAAGTRRRFASVIGIAAYVLVCSLASAVMIPAFVDASRGATGLASTNDDCVECPPERLALVEPTSDSNSAATDGRPALAEGTEARPQTILIGEGLVVFNPNLFETVTATSTPGSSSGSGSLPIPHRLATTSTSAPTEAAAEPRQTTSTPTTTGDATLATGPSSTDPAPTTTRPPTTAASTTTTPPPAAIALRSALSAVSTREFGSVDASTVSAMFGRSPMWLSNGHRLAVSSDGGEAVLVQQYVPTGEGTDRVSFAFETGGRDRATLTYRVRFREGWAWVYGGKLPGLAGGNMPTGGNHSDGGFSARFMWREGGQLVVYAYYPGMSNNWGEDIPVGFTLPVGKWTTIRQEIVMNDQGRSNGVLKVWINGNLLLSRSDMTWRTRSEVNVDRFLYSSFYGGNEPKWAPSTTTYAEFADFEVTTQ